jgi:hypothetical protein
MSTEESSHSVKSESEGNVNSEQSLLLTQTFLRLQRLLAVDLQLIHEQMSGPRRLGQDAQDVGRFGQSGTDVDVFSRWLVLN